MADEALRIMVVVGSDGRVLWREGSSAVRRRADSLGFVEGAAWDEDTVGTNAIGTALVARRPVQVYSAEHYVRPHHVWTCAAAPVHDPRSGRLLGVVDVSGPAATVHASTLALVDAVAHLAQNQLRADHRTELDGRPSTDAGADRGARRGDRSARLAGGGDGCWPRPTGSCCPTVWTARPPGCPLTAPAGSSRSRAAG